MTFRDSTEIRIGQALAQGYGFASIFFSLAGVRDGVVEVHVKQEIRSRCNYEVVKSKHYHLGGHISVLDAILGRGGNYYGSSLKEDKEEVELTADPELLEVAVSEAGNYQAGRVIVGKISSSNIWNFMSVTDGSLIMENPNIVVNEDTEYIATVVVKE